jgi:hypothetical protein
MATHRFCWPRANKKAYVLGTRQTAIGYSVAYSLASAAYYQKLAVAAADAQAFADRNCSPSCRYKKIVYTSNHQLKTRVTGGGGPAVPVTVEMNGGFTINVVCARNKTEAAITEKRLAVKAKAAKRKAR